MDIFYDLGEIRTYTNALDIPKNFEAFKNIHFPVDEEYNGNFFVVMKNKNRLKMVRTISTIKEGSSLPEINAFSSRNYYVTANVFRGGVRRKSQLFALTNIVVDIDNHKIPRRDWLQEFIDGVANTLLTVWLPATGIPLPNSIIYTGRGLQLWWTIEHLPVKAFLWMYTYVAKYFCNSIGEKMAADPNVDPGFQVDVAASTNPAGLFRWPFSRNTKARRDVRYEPIHARALDLPAYYAALRDAEAPLPPNPKGKYFLPAEEATYVSAEEREHALYSLVKLRGGDVERDLFLFCLACIWARILPTDEIMNKVKAMNATFRKPLPEHEWMAYMRSFKRKKYVITNVRIIELLSITDDEMQAIGLHPTGAWARDRAAAHERALEAHKSRKERDARISTLHEEGKSNSAIAEIVGCSLSTVERGLKRSGMKSTALRNQIASLAAQGMSIKGIARELGCSRNTVRSVMRSN